MSSTLNPIEPVKLFISYAHQDSNLCKEFKKHLNTFEELISSWSDGEILPGQEWDAEIKNQLEASQIILLLISVDFITSPYCRSVELKTAMDRHRAGKAVVIPIFLKACNWKSQVFGGLQGIPDDAKPITSWKDWKRDNAFVRACEKIAEVAKNIKSNSVPIDRNILNNNSENEPRDNTDQNDIQPEIKLEDRHFADKKQYRPYYTDQETQASQLDWSKVDSYDGLEFLPELWSYTFKYCTANSLVTSYPDEAFVIKALLEPSRSRNMVVGLATEKGARVAGKIALRLEKNSSDEANWFGERVFRLYLSLDNDAKVRTLLDLLKLDSFVSLERRERIAALIAKIDNNVDRARVLSAMASNLARQGELDAAKKIADSITLCYNKAIAWGTIAEKEAIIGQTEYTEACIREIEQEIEKKRDHPDDRETLGYNPDDRDIILSGLAVGYAKVGKTKEAYRIIVKHIINSEYKNQPIAELALALAKNGEGERAASELELLEEEYLLITTRAKLSLINVESKKNPNIWIQAEIESVANENTPDKTKLWLELLDYYISANQIEIARMIVNKLEETEKSRALFKLALGLAEAGESEKARQTFEEAEQLLLPQDELSRQRAKSRFLEKVDKTQQESFGSFILAVDLMTTQTYPTLEQIRKLSVEGLNNFRSKGLRYAEPAWKQTEELIKKLQDSREALVGLRLFRLSLAKAKNPHAEQVATVEKWEERVYHGIKEMIRNIANEYARFRELLSLAADIGSSTRSDSLKQEAADTAEVLSVVLEKVLALAELNKLEEAGRLSEELPKGDGKDKTLVALAESMVSKRFFDRVEELAGQIINIEDRAQVLQMLVDHLPDPQVKIELVARWWKKATSREEALHYLPMASELYRNRSELCDKLVKLV